MKTDFQNIYAKIGYLLYAIASERRKFSAVEHQQLRKLVALRWEHETNGSTGLQTLLLANMYNSMWEGFHKEIDSARAFELFSDCYNLHKLNFGTSLREKILVTAEAIGQDFCPALNGHGSKLLKDVKQLLLESPLVLTDKKWHSSATLRPTVSNS